MEPVTSNVSKRSEVRIVALLDVNFVDSTVSRTRRGISIKEIFDIVTWPHSFLMKKPGLLSAGNPAFYSRQFAFPQPSIRMGAAQSFVFRTLMPNFTYYEDLPGLFGQVSIIMLMIFIIWFY